MGLGNLRVQALRVLPARTPQSRINGCWVEISLPQLPHVEPDKDRHFSEFDPSGTWPTLSRGVAVLELSPSTNQLSSGLESPHRPPFLILAGTQ